MAMMMMVITVMIDDDDDDCDDKVLCPRNVDDPGQRREAAIAPTLAHIIIVIIARNILRLFFTNICKELQEILFCFWQGSTLTLLAPNP